MHHCECNAGPRCPSPSDATVRTYRFDKGGMHCEQVYPLRVDSLGFQITDVQVSASGARMVSMERRIWPETCGRMAAKALAKRKRAAKMLA
eukprot:3131757-Prymnesium_polylepis.1